MTNPNHAFSEYHTVLRAEIRSIGQQLTQLAEDKLDGGMNMSNNMRESKFQGLVSLCQHALNLMQAMETRSRDMGVSLSEEAKEWCAWCEEVIRPSLARMSVD
jgi:hypothetical protein